MDEPVITEPAGELWDRLGVKNTWSTPLARFLLDSTTDALARANLKFRPVVALPRLESFPHPVSFPRYAPFRPKSPLLLYVDRETIGVRSQDAGDLQGIMQLIRSLRQISLSELPKDGAATIVRVEGVLGFSNHLWVQLGADVHQSSLLLLQSRLSRVD